MMEGRPQAKIISYNINSTEVCASAARISTTPGDANEIFEQSKENPKNADLIEKVLRSGHKSVIEHAVFTVAFWNISVFVEQYLIEFRLASFTVKSRRYVDFSKFGYYTPPELDGDDEARYRHYMEPLFSAYGDLLRRGVPKEDARFVLPYSFRSNFYCTLNARELVHVIRSIRCGRGRAIPELQNLADQLVNQIETVFPCLLPELNNLPRGEQTDAACTDVFPLDASPCFVGAQETGAVKLVGAPADPIAILRAAYAAGAPGSVQPFRIGRLLASARPRELEQLTYSLSVSDVTLSGITHFVRHRMQSVIVPPIQSVNHSRYIVPESIKNEPGAWDAYRSALEAAHRALQEIVQRPPLRKYGYYFAVSGNMMDVMTTMNARELKLFLQLRSCSRAQWEIRKIAVSVLRRLREHCPALYDRFGPSCYLLGRCPEGALTCGKMDEVCAAFHPQSRPEE